MLAGDNQNTYEHWIQCVRMIEVSSLESLLFRAFPSFFQLISSYFQHAKIIENNLSKY